MGTNPTDQSIEISNMPLTRTPSSPVIDIYPTSSRQDLTQGHFNLGVTQESRFVCGRCKKMLVFFVIVN